MGPSGIVKAVDILADGGGTVRNRVCGAIVGPQETDYGDEGHT
jgi:hypothetical protein